MTVSNSRNWMEIVGFFEGNCPLMVISYISEVFFSLKKIFYCEKRVYYCLITLLGLVLCPEIKAQLVTGNFQDYYLVTPGYTETLLHEFEIGPDGYCRPVTIKKYRFIVQEVFMVLR
jgi:hypothetical protein